MKFYRLLLVISFVLGCTLGYAQELKVTAFQRMDTDLLARTQERLDLNGTPCGIVRVSIRNAEKVSFEGNIIGDVIYKPGEAIVYMTDRSRNLTLKSNEFGTLKYEFPERIDKRVVYKLSIKVIEDEDTKRRTLVMPVIGVGGTLSYGLMVGVVQKWGMYLKAKYDFKSLSTEGECTNDATNNWYTGGVDKNRFSVTAGAMYHAAIPLYLYAGIGYGYKNTAWEVYDQFNLKDDMQGTVWQKNTNESVNGLEAELGLIYRLNNWAMSLGVQTNSFKYVEATLGVGIMF